MKRPIKEYLWYSKYNLTALVLYCWETEDIWDCVDGTIQAMLVDSRRRPAGIPSVYVSG